MEVWITYNLSLGFDTRASKAYSTQEKAIQGIKAGYDPPLVWELPITLQDKKTVLLRGTVKYPDGEERRSWMITPYTVDMDDGDRHE